MGGYVQHRAQSEINTKIKIIPAKHPNSEMIKTSLIYLRHDAGTLRGHCVALCARLQKCSPQGQWRNRSESHVEKHREGSFGAPLGPFGVHLGSLRILLYPLGSFRGSSGVLWNPLGLLRGSFGAPWGSLLGSFGEVLWSFGIPLGTKGEPKRETNETKSNWDQVGLSGVHLGPSGDQIGTKCGPNRTK